MNRYVMCACVCMGARLLVWIVFFGSSILVLFHSFFLQHGFGPMVHVFIFGHAEGFFFIKKLFI